MADSPVIQMDNGTKIEFTVQDSYGVVKLVNITSIKLVVVNGERRVEKDCTVTDAENGKCYATLTSSDVSNKGTYLTQINIAFNDGSSFSSNINKFLVGTKL